MKRRTFVAMAVAALADRGMAFELNYDELVPLDAQALAEGGIAGAYEQIEPALRKYVAAPAEVREKIRGKHSS